ncbi:SCO6745 family protein [Streptomyces sp. NPDC001070]
MSGTGWSAEAAVTARRVWRLAEPVHAATYFAPEARAAYEEAGLRGFWRGCFAGRAAPLGPVGPEPVVAAFFGFAPAMVARALPAVWEQAPPERALEVRRRGAGAAPRRLLAGQEAAVAEAVALLRPVAAGLDVAGRVLAAANSALPVPRDPIDALWHHATVLREHRGDGHVAALVAAGLDGCEALVLRTGIDLPRAELQPNRGWTDAQWDAARARLTSRGLLGADGAATSDGREAHRVLEDATDRAAGRPWEALDPVAVDRLVTVLSAPARARAGALRFPNPIGVPAP